MRLEITAVAGPGAVPFQPAELSVSLPRQVGEAPSGAAEVGTALGSHAGGLPGSGGSPDGSAVVEALSARWPACSFTVAGVPLGDLRVGQRPLTDGAVVVVQGDVGPLGGAGTGRGPRSDAPAVLAVRSGPGAGAMFALHRGRYRLGRGRCQIVIDDPTLSRNHGTLTVGERAMTLTAAPGSTGFSILRGWQDDPLVVAVPLKGTAAVEVGDLIRCGMSGLAIELRTPAGCATDSRDPGLTGPRVDGAGVSGPGADGFGVSGLGAGGAGLDGDAPDGFLSIPSGSGADDAALDHAPGRGAGLGGDAPAGFLSIPSGPRLDRGGLLDAAVLDPVKLPHGAGPPRSRWAMTSAGLLPLVIGVLFAWLTGSWMFLGFAAMGAVAVISPLLGGVRRRREFSALVGAAAVRDAARRTAAFPGADVLVGWALHSGAVNAKPGVAVLRGPDPGVAALRDTDPAGRRLAVRVGTAAQRALVEPVPDYPGFLAPLSSELPMSVPVGQSPVQIAGAPGPLRLLLHFVLMQLDAAGVPVVLMGPVRELPLSARFLPLTVLAGSLSGAVAAVNGLGAGAGTESADGAGPGTVAGRAAAAVPDCVLVSIGQPPTGVRAVFPGIRVLHFTSRLGRSGDDAADVQLQPDGNGAAGMSGGHSFVPDGVPAHIFDRYARARSGSGRSVSTGQAMAPCTVPLPSSSPRAVADRWLANAGGPLTPVPVGRSAAGSELFNFASDGPHLLVGGTTGSGKSEFLRTLVGSLAVAHSPADLQFVFVDFKGGAGLGTLQKFPHTSALVTDLDGRGMDRILGSLRAEIKRRELVLGNAEAADCDAYRSSHANTERGVMAHLVIVIDEFRVLVDQYPVAMAELMRIAAVGRSLGIHLVMATQRPQGAVNADIRANVTSSVCLRVQSTFDSQDVIGSGVAAAIGIDTPGRAFISRAGGRPTEFQSATLRLSAFRGGQRPTADLAVDFLQNQIPPGQGGGAAPVAGPVAVADRNFVRGMAGANDGMGGDSDVDSVAGLLTAAWRMLSRPRRQGWAAQDPGTPGTAEPASAPSPTPPLGPPLPWTAARVIVAPELPRELDLDGISVAGTRAGGPGSREAWDPVLVGLVDVPERQSLETLLWSPSRHSHVACVGPRTASSPAVGLLAAQCVASNTAGEGSSKQYLYILDGDGSMRSFSGCPWVGSYVTPSGLRTAARLLLRLGETAAATDAHLVVLVSDWGHWVAAFRSSPWPWAEDSVGELVRRSRPQLAVVLGGERELLSAPFMAAIPNRLFLPYGASSESRLLWPRIPRFTPIPGRAAVLGPMNAAAARGQADDPHVAQLGAAPSPPHPSGTRPWVPSSGDANQEQPWLTSPNGNPPVLESSGSPKPAAPPEPPLVVVGLPEHLSLVDARRAMAWSRRDATESEDPGTGGLHNHSRAHSITVGLGGDGRSPVSVSLATGRFLPVLGGPGSGKSTFMAALRDLNGAPDGIMWVDDATLLTQDQLLAITRTVASGSCALVAVPNHLPSLSRLPLEWGLRTAEQGIVLTPRRQQDGDLFGVRLDTAGSEPLGRAVFIDCGRMEWFQFPHTETLGDPDGQLQQRPFASGPQ
ncbi:hypothetical protein CVV68_02270 [Arthrobacter livingstonensis]|uniref:FtsK domain-containing protein n=1 Tax=Arthrobacter livingstonensis TaxID=670078 RepID=A0A2V5LC91_9MICC|nr:FtsK/SpoIIIE domain-containing protein [Arthrobacter livingstonensis]PYI69255.1 hypothetical protein CVV68_02270 [Arthrobacter livingstonensis]